MWPPLLQWKCDPPRGVASLEGDNVVVFYYLSTSEIWPYKMGATVIQVFFSGHLVKSLGFCPLSHCCEHFLILIFFWKKKNVWKRVLRFLQTNLIFNLCNFKVFSYDEPAVESYDR